MTVAALDPSEVRELAAERRAAEVKAQAQAFDANPAPAPAEPSPPAAEPGAGATETPAAPELTLDAHCAQLDMVCGLLMAAGGRELPARKRLAIVHLTYPAAKKYAGQELPYFAEACACAGVAMLIRESFFVHDEPADERKAAA